MYEVPPTEADGRWVGSTPTVVLEVVGRLGEDGCRDSVCGMWPAIAGTAGGVRLVKYEFRSIIML